MPKEHFSVESLARLLLDLDSAVASGKLNMCTTQFVQVCHNVAFLVDLQALDDPMDIRADENGGWDCKGSPVTYVSIHNGGGTIAVYKCSHMGSHSHHYKINRVYYRHSSSPDFTMWYCKLRIAMWFRKKRWSAKEKRNGTTPPLFGSAFSHVLMVIFSPFNCWYSE